MRPLLSNKGRIGNPGSPKDTTVALDLIRRTERLRVVIGELHRRAAFDARDFADKADGIKSVAVVGIASSKIVRQQRAPTGAEPDPPLRPPFCPIMKISGIPKVGWFQARRDLAPEVGMQTQDCIHVE